MKIKFKRYLLILASLIALYAFLGFVVLPMVIESQVPKLIESKTGRVTTLGNVRFNPFVLKMDIENFAIADDNKKSDFLRWDRLSVNFQWIQSIIEQGWAFKEITLKGPYGNIIRYGNNRFNFSDILDKNSSPNKDKAEDKPDEGIAVFINNIQLIEGRLDYLDHASEDSFKESIAPINISIKHFSTLSQSDNSPLVLETHLASGGTLQWRGDVNMSQMTSRGHIDISGVHLSRLWRFIQSNVNFQIVEGKGGVGLDYEFMAEHGSPNLIMKHGQLLANDISITPKHEDQEIIKIPLVELNDLYFNLQAREIKAKEFITQDGVLESWLSKEGKVNLQTVFAPVRDQTQIESEQGNDKEKSQKPWKLTVGKAKVKNYNVNFTDNTRDQPVHNILKPIDITVSNLSTDPRSTADINAEIVVNNQGTIQVTGVGSIVPVMADIHIDGKNIDIEPYQPYLNEIARLKLKRGAFDVTGKVALKLEENSDPSLKFTGDLSLRELRTNDTVRNLDFLNWEALIVKGIEYDLNPMKLNIEEVISDGLFSRVVIEKDHSTNISSIFEVPTKKQARKHLKKLIDKSQPQKPQTLPITIGKITIKNASSYFADLSLVIPFAVDISDLNGHINGFSSELKKKTKALIKGKVDKISPVLIRGELYPLQIDQDTDIFMQFKNVNLTTATPYMAQFAGYKVEKGRISLDLHYKVKNRKLYAENKMVIEQLTLGDPVKSPDAVHAPVKLAVALLKDPSGVIKLELPIRGNLDDPQFSVAALIGKALLNVITKVAASPFTMLASIVGAKDDLSYVKFASGSDELTPEERNKLDLLGKALQKRPELQLEIKGSAYKDYDWPGIANHLLLQELLSIKGESGKTTTALSQQEYRDLLHQLFRQKFPQSADTFESVRSSDDPKVVEGYYRMVKQKLLSKIPYNPNRLAVLAKQRAQTIAKYLIDHKDITPDRIYLLELDFQEKTPPEGAKIKLNVKPK